MRPFGLVTCLKTSLPAGLFYRPDFTNRARSILLEFYESKDDSQQLFDGGKTLQ
jgi:hypothetical protein